MLKHFNITVTGTVQGVFYRAFIKTEAQKLGLFGFVRNEPNGNVYIEAEGKTEHLKSLIENCKIGPPRSIVSGVKVTESELKNFSDFSINR